MADNESARSAFKIRGALVGLFRGETQRLVSIGVMRPEADMPTLIALAAAKSLEEKNEFDLVDQARNLVAMLEERHVFPKTERDWKMVPLEPWDPAILRSALAFKAFFQDKSKGRDPNHHAPPDLSDTDIGSGPACRAVALGAFYAAKFPDKDRADGLIDDVMHLSLMTHDDARAGVAAVAIATAIHLAATTGFGQRPYTPEYGGAFIARRVDTAERRYAHCYSGSPPFSKRLALALGSRGDRSRLLNVCLAQKGALRDVPLAIACWLNHPRDFQAGVGRDSIFWLEKRLRDAPPRDSVYAAALTGALIGATIGTQPMRHMTHLADAGLADLIGNGLYKAGK